MRALVYTGPWTLEVHDRPDPMPGPGEVRLRVIATGICGSDLHGYTGETGRRHAGQVMGHESVAIIDAVGPDVADQELALGTVATFNPVIGCGRCGLCTVGLPQQCEESRVIGVDPQISAALAEYTIVPAANVVTLPSAMPAEYGALVEPLSVGYHAAVRGRCRADDRVLVIGGGPIGQACFLAAGRRGADHVVVSDLRQDRRALVIDLGAVAVDPTDDGAATVVDRLGGKATLVLDTVGTTDTIRTAIAASTRGARIVLVGMEAPSLEISAYDISVHERTLIGSFCYSPQEFRDTANWISTVGDLPARLISDRISLLAAPAAFAALVRGELDASKILVFPNGR